MLPRPGSRLKILTRHLSSPSHPRYQRIMSTFTLPNSNPPIPIHLTSDITSDQLLAFPAFKTWIGTLQHSLGLQRTRPDHPFHGDPYRLQNIAIQAVDYFGSKKIGFIKLKAEVKNESGESLPGSVFLRGGAVGMLVILQPDDVPVEDVDEKYVILTVQPRVPAGSLAMVELPAGMIDDGTFGGSAAKEIHEELGIDIPESELINLTELAIPPSSKEGEEELQRAFYTSGGGSDEFIAIFLHEKRVPRGELSGWTGKLTGLREQGEKITLKLVKLRELWREAGRDSKALAAVAYYDGLKREGKI